MRMSNEDIRQYYATLTECAKNGTLTVQQLDEAVNCVTDVRDDYSRSLGFEWIVRNTGSFCHAVADVPAFLWRHVENYYFGVLVVLHADLLELLPEGDRARYVRASVMQHGTRNRGWVKAAQKVGVTNEELAEIVLDRLRATVVKRGMTNFLDEFLRYGHDKEWPILTDEQLEAALKICVEKSPANVLATWMYTVARLGEEPCRAIMIAAAEQLDQVHHLWVLGLLPIETRVALLRRIGKIDNHLYSDTAQLIVEVALEKGVEFYEEMQPVIEQINVATFLTTVHSTLQESKGKGDARQEKAREIERLVLQRCSDAGYLIGTITLGRYFDRQAQQERTQLQVEVDGHTYVESKYRSHRDYYPKEGDTVIFQPANGSTLTPWVKAVHFTEVK